MLLEADPHAAPRRRHAVRRRLRPLPRCCVDWIAAGAPGPDGRRPDARRGSRSSRRPRCSSRRTRCGCSSGPVYSDGTRRGRDPAGPSSCPARSWSPTVDEDGQVTVAGPRRGGDHRPASAPGSPTLTVTSPFPNTVDRRGVRQGAAAQLHRRPGPEEAASCCDLPPSPDCTDAEFIRRAYLDACGILPTPDEVDGVPRRHVAGQAGEADRHAAGAAGVRRLLGVQVVGPAAGLEPQAAAAGDVGVLPLGPPERGRQQAVGPVRPRHR